MFGGLLPKEFGFFKLFNESAGLIVESAAEFMRLLADPAGAAVHASKIKELEHRADDVTHRTMTMLHKTFITPLDREDIHDLIKRLDDIIDFIDASAQRLVLYEVRVIPPEMVRLAQITAESVDCVQQAVNKLRDVKHPEEMMKLCVDINRLENEADQVLRAAVAKLFREEQDLRLLIKLKEIYELLETVTDRCEDVANVIESIVLEYA